MAATACPLYRAFFVAIIFSEDHDIFSVPSPWSIQLSANFGRSLPVITANTPSTLDASEVSMLFITACA